MYREASLSDEEELVRTERNRRQPSGESLSPVFTIAGQILCITMTEFETRARFASNQVYLIDEREQFTKNILISRSSRETPSQRIAKRTVTKERTPSIADQGERCLIYSALASARIRCFS